MKNIRLVSEKHVAKACARFGIPLENAFELDTAFIGRLAQLPDQSLRKDLLQPLQVHYFQKGQAQPLAFFANCYAGGFPNLQWNRNAAFDTFPAANVLKKEGLLPVSEHLTYAKPYSFSGKSLLENNTEHCILLYWSCFMGRQSKRFIKLVQENAALKKGEAPKILYLSTDIVHKTLESK